MPYLGAAICDELFQLESILEKLCQACRGVQASELHAFIYCTHQMGAYIARTWDLHKFERVSMSIKAGCSHRAAAFKPAVVSEAQPYTFKYASSLKRWLELSSAMAGIWDMLSFCRAGANTDASFRSLQPAMWRLWRWRAERSRRLSFEQPGGKFWGLLVA